MLIDTKKVKEIIEVYVELDEKRQEKLLEKALVLHFEQIAEEHLKMEKKCYSDDEIQEKAVEMFRQSEDVIEMIANANEEQLAGICILLEKLKGKNLWEDKKIKIVLESEELSIEEFVKRKFPKANYELLNQLADDAMKRSTLPE